MKGGIHGYNKESKANDGQQMISKFHKFFEMNYHIVLEAKNFVYMYAILEPSKG